MLKLVIDQGNTQTKLALFQQKKMLKKILFNNDSQLRELENQADAVILSSVGDASDLIQVLKDEPVLLNTKTSLPIANLYESPETLGNDRIAVVVGAAKQIPKSNVLVIDAGTCITLDLLTTEGYHGGSITPGIQMRLQALNQQTEKLPLVELDVEVDLIGKNTKQCIQSGVINGVLLEIDGMINRYKSQFSDLKVLLTGGDFQLFDKGLKNSIFADPDLVLKGLNEILDYNEAIS
ncbi:MAG: pantothenate kinase [Flavobacteriales bacterium]|nr:pantothenate kinase [Flavobacteriales bacterium]